VSAEAEAEEEEVRNRGSNTVIGFQGEVLKGNYEDANYAYHLRRRRRRSPHGCSPHCRCARCCTTDR
jgi:hypothetical protein